MCFITEQALKKKFEKLVGEKLKIKLKKSPRKFITRDCVVLSAYPHIFTLRVFHPNYEEISAYSYVDIISKDIEFVRGKAI